MSFASLLILSQLQALSRRLLQGSVFRYPDPRSGFPLDEFLPVILLDQDESTATASYRREELVCQEATGTGGRCDEITLPLSRNYLVATFSSCYGPHLNRKYSYLPTPLIPYQQKCLWAREGGNVLLISTEHVCQETGKPDLQQQAANTAFNTAFHAGRPEGTTTLPEQIKPFLYNWE